MVNESKILMKSRKMNNVSGAGKTKVLLLFSGGLDSRIALKVLQEQSGLDVEMVFFVLPFGGGCCNNFDCVFNYSQTEGVKLHVIDLTKKKFLKEYLDIVREPKHGFGTGMNPCKDCKILMLRHAKKLGEEIGAEVIATGEVLSQRPMSQLKHQLDLTERMSGLVGKLLRPLSAKLLKLTDAEKSGLLDRNKLLDISGRQRKRQMELAKKYKIKYPDSGGGCLLCEKDYCKKLKDLFMNDSFGREIKFEDIKLLNVGRHFRFKGKVVLGRDKEENKVLEFLGEKLGYNVEVSKIPGPSAIFEDKKNLKLVNELMVAYSKGSGIKGREKFKSMRI
ncbi:tRNA 4-thiouridine(8) synthase ThiI [archaeon]|jgi:tRNA-uridine 2-sulfurtransferase|nr:tRNA 4-thiouridine(8) synthase ThiI [archaeon]